MRVLQVVHGFPPASLGGTEVYARDLSVALASAGAEVAVLAREADPSRPEHALRSERAGGLDVTFVNNTFAQSRSFEDSYRQPVLRRIAAAVLDRVKPDIVHVQHLTGLSTDLPAECAQRGIPVVMTLADFWLACHRGQMLDVDLARCAGPTPAGCARCIGMAGPAGPGLYRAAAVLRGAGLRLPTPAAAAGEALGRLASPSRAESVAAARAALVHDVARSVSLFLSPSRTVRERFVALGIPPERIVLHEYGIDVARLRSAARTRGDRLRIGFVGSLMVSKAPHLLLEAFARLPQGVASLHVHGAPAAYHGDDSYRARLEPLLRAPGVHWEGPSPHERIPSVLSSLDVLVVPSIWLENSPLVIREAFAAGVPVVASDLGGMAEMVADGTDGLLFEPGSIDSLHRALARLVDEAGLLDRLRENVPPVRGIDDDARATLALYREVTQAGSAATATAPRIAAIVLNYRTPAETAVAVRSLQASRRPLSDILVVDNGSGDGSAEALRRECPGVDVLEAPRNLGFSGGCNLGISEAMARGADLLLLVNSDAVVPPGAVERVEAALLADAARGIATPVLCSFTEPDLVLSAGIRFSTRTGRMRHLGFGRRGGPGEGGAVEVDAASACVMLVRREVFERAGLLDEAFFFSFEDIEFCLRARRAGFRTVVARDATAHHDGSLTIGPRSPRRLYFAARNHLLLASRSGERLFPLQGTFRAAWIVALNLAFAMRAGGAPRIEGLRSVLLGALHHLRRRYHDGP